MWLLNVTSETALDEILAMLNEAGAEVARRESTPIADESTNALAEETKQRLRCRGARESRWGSEFWYIFVVKRTTDMPAAEQPVVHSDPDIMSGTPVFVGTRVPFQTLIDYLEAGQPLSEFLEDFPTVSKEQAIAALEQAKEALLARARPA
jgi:uncharacterized protein (DUF433 family)